jgi:hypothetical protein
MKGPWNKVVRLGKNGMNEQYWTVGRNPTKSMERGTAMGKKMLALSAAVMVCVWGFGAPALCSDDVTVVARVTHVEGQLLRYVPEEDDWVVVGKDSPVGEKDLLYMGEGGRAEVYFPNRVVMRLNEFAQFEVGALGNDLVQVIADSGQMRFFNLGVDVVVRVDTALGYVVAPSDTTFDLYVGEESVEVIGIDGAVDFIHVSGGSETRYEVRGGSSVLADRRNVERGDGEVDGAWDDWNAQRDETWRRQSEVRSPYLPGDLQSEAHDLQDYGRWVSVEYEGQPRTLWHPVRVGTGWSPFTCGRWTRWYGDQVWIPHEPFGYVTHHYGHWVMVNGMWYWIPPGILAASQALHWHPGRVGWFYTDATIGWVPLAPHEIYYGHRAWGPDTVLFNQVGATAPDPRAYRNISQCIIVPKGEFYAGHRQYGLIRDQERAGVLSQARAAAVIDRTVLKDVPDGKAQFRFASVDPDRKPHRTVVGRLQIWGRPGSTRDGQSLRKAVERTGRGKAGSPGQVSPPRLVDRLVDVSDVSKPQVQFRQRPVRERKATVGAESAPKVSAPTSTPGSEEPGQGSIQIRTRRESVDRKDLPSTSPRSGSAETDRSGEPPGKVEGGVTVPRTLPEAVGQGSGRSGEEERGQPSDRKKVRLPKEGTQPGTKFSPGQAERLQPVHPPQERREEPPPKAASPQVQPQPTQRSTPQQLPSRTQDQPGRGKKKGEGKEEEQGK